MQSEIDQDRELRKRFVDQLAKLSIPSRIVGELVEHQTVVSYPRGALIFGYRSPADVLFWVLSGVVKLRYPLPDGRGVTIGLSGQGELLGPTVIMDGERGWLMAFETRAFTKCSLALVPRELVCRLLVQSEAGILWGLLERAIVGWSSLVNRQVCLLSLSTEDRLKFVLQEIGQRFGVSDERGTFIPLRLGHQDLAEMIGVSRSMVSRLVAGLIREGTVICAAHRSYILARGKQLFIENLPTPMPSPMFAPDSRRRL